MKPVATRTYSEVPEPFGSGSCSPLHASVSYCRDLLLRNEFQRGRACGLLGEEVDGAAQGAHQPAVIIARIIDLAHFAETYAATLSICV